MKNFLHTYATTQFILCWSWAYLLLGGFRQLKKIFNKVWMGEKRQIVECILKTSYLIKSKQIGVTTVETIYTELLICLFKYIYIYPIYKTIFWTILSYCPTPIPQTPQHLHRRQGSFRGHRYQLQTRRLLSRSSDCGSCREKTVP